MNIIKQDTLHVDTLPLNVSQYWKIKTKLNVLFVNYQVVQSHLEKIDEIFYNLVPRQESR